jgi:alkylation response protein AidB-like acyl-CoA dehydrogenase
MTGLDAAQRAMRACCAEVIPDLRSRALAVDADPAAVEQHLDSPGLCMVRSATTPKEYRDHAAPTALDAYETGSCLDRVICTVELACGDAGMLTACTGPSLAGMMVDAVGSKEQREFFYGAIADGRGWTFFAMTEPELGSDGTTIRTRLERDPAGGYRLHGVKRYISNGARARIGVAIARTGPSPLSIRAALLSCPAPGVTGHPLDTTGLRGARISMLEFDGVPVPEEMLLGSHLPPSRRGLWGIARTFNGMRVQIGALGLGTALALANYVHEQRPGAPQIEVVFGRLAAARHLLYEAASSVDHDPDDQRPPSAAKLYATTLAVAVARWAATALGPATLLEHPLIEKWRRDVCAFEFMDGTSNIQRLQVARDFPSGRGADRRNAHVPPR